MYEGKLGGRLSNGPFDRKAKETRSKQQALRAKISQHQSDSSDLRASFNMMRLTSIAAGNSSARTRGNALPQPLRTGRSSCYYRPLYSVVL